MYSNGNPTELRFLNDFSWNTSHPKSTVSGSQFICATARGDHVVLWEINHGTIHRDLKFEFSVVKSIAFDEIFNAIWIATNKFGYFVSINGDTLAYIKIEDNVTAMAVMPLSIEENDRKVICGCSNGSLFIASSRIENKTIEMKRLPSEHKAKIDHIVINQNNKSFMSVDKDGIAYIWTAQGMNAQIVKPSFFDGCAICGNPQIHNCCSSCGRGICEKCMFGGTCSLCAALVVC
ncbi:Beige/BEACH domain containing protein [Histomonas meleagridis]|uniref:Beige/BEACH domain containing protein n=1 Tax=Histomonas meleagridis TaxID=135588 RepID=UPI00355ABD5A|nr:Beige/BEACH domain containing protein [Histomonas meleagridis]KAH0798452.1 Beige/BEACH domain containing protein [Histomonas meleagridis]